MFYSTFEGVEKQINGYREKERELYRERKREVEGREGESDLFRILKRTTVLEANSNSCLHKK